MGLTLSRKEGERILIGDDIIVTVERIDLGRVRLKFEAPSQVKIFREEVYREIHRLNDREPQK